MIVFHIFLTVGNAATASKRDPENGEHSKLGECYPFGGDAKEGAVGKATSLFISSCTYRCMGCTIVIPY